MCIYRQHNPIFQPTYRPIEAAIFWCDLQQHQGAILEAARGAPSRFMQCLRFWPDLNRRFNKIMDAITHGELPSVTSDFQVPMTISQNYMHVSIRHIELQRWMVRYYPDQRPSFLFNSGPSCPFSEELCTTLARRVDSLNAQRQCDQDEITQLRAELETARQELSVAKNQLARVLAPNEKSRANYERTVAAVLKLLQDCSFQGTPLASQDTIISLIETRHASIRGLSRRSLQQRFAESLRTLNEEG